MKSLAVFGVTYVFVLIQLVLFWGESLNRVDFLLIPLVLAVLAAAFAWKPQNPGPPAAR